MAASSTTIQHGLDQYTIAQTQRVIERLAFPSGGSRYVFLFGVYAALYKTGLLKNVEQVAGTSAGALIATMVALGADPNELYINYSKTDLLQLFGDSVGSMWGNTDGITPLTRDGKPIVAKLQEIITNIMQNFFATDEAQSMLRQHTDLNVLAARFQGTDPKLSFRDLEMLHRLFPSRFKQLVFETVVYPTGEIHVINTTSSHGDIAEACYAAAAIPGILAPIEIDGHLLIDGGTNRQMPFDAFDFPLPNQKPLNTLVVTFTDPPYEKYENTSSFRALYKGETTEKFYEPNFVEKYLRNSLMPFLTGLNAGYKNTESWNQNYAALARDYPLNTVEISPCGLLQYKFSQALTCARQFYASGFMDTINYLINHELCMSECEAEDLYHNLRYTFEFIYQAAITGSNMELEKDSFWREYQKCKNGSAATAKNCCLFLHDYLKIHIESTPAMALAYAVEFVNDALTADDLFKDVYKLAFNRSRWFKSSSILGHSVYKSDTLKEGLNSYSLFSAKSDNPDETKAHVLQNLLEIPKFLSMYEVGEREGHMKL